MTAPNLPSLKAMAEQKLEGIQKATYFKVHPSLVKFEEGFNLRTEGPDLTAYIRQLADAMKAGAQVPPIDVAVIDGVVLARDGHCRTRAARLLLEEGIEYLLEARQFRGNEADAVFHMIGTGGSKHYSPLEQGQGFARLVAYGQTVAQIAARLGLHRSTIENGLALAQTPVAVQQMVASGEVASHLALKTVRVFGSDGQSVLKRAVETAKAEGKTKATGKHVKTAYAAGGPVLRGQTLPPVTNDNPAHVELLKRLAAVNIVVSRLDRDQIVALVQDARNFVGVAL